ncbi:MAG: MBL fold metallo-hydrolase [Desulfurococcales archaeon]|nr:MBL fold metallo-hydrolase [Desulfurococcales archaeon]
MVGWLRLYVLDDNEPAPGFRSEWGWSVYLEAPGWRAIFDADTSPSIIEYNAGELGVDLGRLEWGFLSHHHYDHKGGYPAIARARPGLRVYVPPGETGDMASWGLEPVVVKGPTRVAGDALSTGPLSSGLWGIEEHALAVEVEGLGLVVIVGCSHPGVDRLAEAAARAAGARGVAVVIGGFHGPSRATLDRLAGMARWICPTHCSGSEAKEYVRTTYPDKYCAARTGSVLQVDRDGPALERY